MGFTLHLDAHRDRKRKNVSSQAVPVDNRCENRRIKDREASPISGLPLRSMPAYGSSRRTHSKSLLATAPGGDASSETPGSPLMNRMTIRYPASIRVLQAIYFSADGVSSAVGRMEGVQYPSLARCLPICAYIASSWGCQVSRPSTYRLYMQNAAAISTVS